MNPRVIVIFNRDFEGAEADPENKAREDIKGIAEHLVEILDRAGFITGALGVTGDVFGAVEAIKAFAPDVVFNLCESIGGDNRFEPLLPLLLLASAFGPLPRRLPMPALLSASAFPFRPYMPNTRITPIRQATIRTIRRRRQFTRRPPAIHLNRVIRLRWAGRAATSPDN